MRRTASAADSGLARVAATGRSPGARADGPAAPWLAGTIGLIVCLVGVWRPAWSGDESATVVILRRSGSEFWAAVSRDPALGPYYLLMRPWSMISMDHAWLRLPSVIAAALAVAVLFAFVRRAAGSPLAVATTTGLLLMPAFSRYGQDARPYAMAMLAVVASVFAWWRWIESSRRRWWVALLGALTAAGLMHAYSLLIVLPLLAAAFAQDSPRRRTAVLGTVAAAAAAVCLLAPFLMVLADRAVGQPDLPRVSAIEVALAAARLPLVGLRTFGGPAAALAFLLLGAWGTLLLVTRRPAGRGFEVLIIGWLLLPPVALTLLQWTTGRPGLVTRYWMLSLPALAIGIGFALVAMRRWWLALGILGLAAILALPSHVSIRTLDGHQGERWLRIPELLGLPGFIDLPLLIQGYSQRGLAANAPDLPPARTPLNGDPGPSGRISPVPYTAGTLQFDTMVAEHDVIVLYQQSVSPRSTPPSPKDFRQADDAREVYSEPLVLCQWFGDAVGLFSKPPAVLGSQERTLAADLMDGVRPARIDCEPMG